MVNTTLVHHGLAQDQSDYRAHVCAGTKMVFVYRTKDMQAYLAKEGKRYRQAEAYQGEVKTALGYTVPLTDLRVPNPPIGLWVLPFPGNWLEELQLTPGNDLADRGQKAELIVMRLIQLGRFPIIGLITKAPVGSPPQRAGIDLSLSLIHI